MFGFREYLRAVATNAGVALHVFHAKPFPIERVRGDLPQLLTSFSFSLLASVCLAVSESWPVGEFNPYELSWILATELIFLAAMAVGVLIVGRGQRFAPVVVVANLVAAFGAFLYLAATLVAPGNIVVAAIVSVVFLLVAPAAAILRGLGSRSFPGALAGLPAFGLNTALIALFTFMVPPSALFFPATLDADAETDPAPLDMESLYYQQPSLMQTEIDGLEAGKAGTPELFAVLGAGYAYESVFLSEIDKVEALLGETHGAGGRIIALANSRTEPERLPMLNHHNLRDALVAVGERMNPDEDVALLFLTSHGSVDRFSLGFWEAGLDGLSATELSDMLDASGIGNVVVVVSACHSGSFIDELAAPNRLIIAAAAEDRSSFGCSDGRDWTDFGRAYFDIALRETPDFRRAFARAAEIVEGWEREQGQRASLPQIAEGAEIGVTLDRLSATRLVRAD